MLCSCVIFPQHPRRPFTSLPRLTPSPWPLVPLQFASLVLSLTDHCPLITARYCFKSFSCNTYGPPHKCCKQKTYGLAKPFRCNTYRKLGVGVFFPLWNSQSRTGHQQGTARPRSLPVCAAKASTHLRAIIAVLLALRRRKRAGNDRAHPCRHQNSG